MSPDGHFVLARDDQSLYLFDTRQQTTVRLGVEVAAGDVFNGALIQPGTTRVLYFTDPGTLQRWDWESETSVATASPSGEVTRATFLPDGSLVVDQPHAAALVWDVDAGRPQRAVDLEAPPTDIGATAITADGGRLVGIEPTGRTYVWDLGTGRLVGDPATRPGTGRAIAASPTDASTIAIGSSGGGISLYDLESETVIGDRLYGHGSGIRDLAYSADGRYLVSIADDGLIGLWGDNGAAGLIAQPVAPDAHNVAYSADGRHALVRNAFTTRQEVRDADALDEPGVLIQPPDGAPGGIGYAQLSADGSTVVAVDGRTSRPALRQRRGDGPPDLDARRRRLRARPVRTCPRTDASAVAIDADSVRLRAWDITSGRRIGDDHERGGAGRARRRSVQRRRAVQSRREAHRRADEPRRRALPRRRPGTGLLRTHARTVRRRARSRASPRADDVIAVGNGGEIVRIDMAESKVVAAGRSADPSALAWAGVSPDGSLVAAYHGFSYQLALFDARTLQPIGKPFPVGDYIFDPTFTRDGRYLAANGLFFGLNHWDVDPDVWHDAGVPGGGPQPHGRGVAHFHRRRRALRERPAWRWPGADGTGSQD